MKHGKRLTKKQKLFLASKGLNPENWLSVKNTSEKMVFVHRQREKTRTFDKKGEGL
ncbi:DUF6906 family protein [Clostridium formicaceticum]|uniref:DUF6906 family protein n=1 Tax=Clostridium formicaceticum TaxID=1497 RepID=UPI001470C518|nr:hypothetical protein [Clostridium formicaceticum]